MWWLLWLLNFITGSALVLVGVAIGRRTRGSLTGSKIKYVCSCGDGYGTHHRDEGCQANHLVKYNASGNKKLMRCACLRYDGPEPPPNIAELWKELS